MANETINLYGQTYEQIVQNVLGGRRDNFQLMSPMLDWTWAPAPSGFIDPRAYRIVGQLPKWTAVGTYEPGGKYMHQAYLEVLNLFNAREKAIREDRVKEATDRVTRAQKKMMEDEQLADLGYSDYRKALPPGIPAKSYEEWIGIYWKGTLDADTLVYNKAVETLALVIGEENTGLDDAIEAATPPKSPSELKPGFVKVKTGPTIEVRPNYIFSDPKQWADRVAAQGGMSLSIKLSASARSTAISKSWAGGVITGAGTIEDVYFAFKGSSGWERQDLTTEDKTVEIEINFRAISMLEVGPDSSWYNSGLLRRLATGGYGGNFPKPAFGEGGVLPLVVTSLIAVYQPSIDITMSEATYNKYSESFNAALGIQIGPFVIGGKGGHSGENWSKYTENKTFHVESYAPYPYIIGITVKNPGM